jgi:glycosyltransferase involved in cell wall biosynthesis
MKILVFTSLYPNNVWPHHGVFIKERMTRVAQLDGCQVQVVAPIPYFPPLKFTPRWRFSQVLRQEVIEGLEVYHPRYFMTPKVGMVSYGATMGLSVFPAIKKIQRRFNFDLIDAHYVYPDGLAAVLLGRLLKKPVVVSARGSDINLFSQLLLIRGLLRYTLRKADHVIAVCQALKEKMIELGIPSEKISVIPNGVDVKKFYPSVKAEARSILGIPSDRKVILSVGNLTPNKGFDLLIKALKILADKGGQEKTPYLVIIGGGKFSQELEQLTVLLGLQDYVRLVGDTPHHDLSRWYSAADLFCLASGREGWPNVLLESLACGTPVVATAAGGIREIITSNRIGLLCERTPQDFAVGIDAALKKSWCAKELIQYARWHTWERVALSVVQVFKQIVESQGPLARNCIIPGKLPS